MHGNTGRLRGGFFSVPESLEHRVVLPEDILLPGREKSFLSKIVNIQFYRHAHRSKKHEPLREGRIVTAFSTLLAGRPPKLPCFPLPRNLVLQGVFLLCHPLPNPSKSYNWLTYFEFILTGAPRFTDQC